MKRQDGKVIVNVKDKRMTPIERPFGVSQVLAANEDIYDTNPIYQRDDCWSLYQRRSLLDSMLLDRSINSFHLCKKPEVVGDPTFKYWVVDGRQRLETMRQFRKGKFKIHVILDTGEVAFLDYKQLNEMSTTDSSCRAFIVRFEQYSLRFNLYENLTAEEQTLLFKAINQSTNLSSSDRIFCTSNLAREFTRHIYKEVKRKIGPWLSNKVGGQKHSCDCRYIMEILVHCFGPELKCSVQQCWDACQSDVKDAAHHVNKVVLNLCQEKGIALDDRAGIETVCETVMEPGLVKRFYEALDAFAYIMDNREQRINGKLKVPDHNWVQDCLIWLRWKIEQNILPPAYIKSNWEKFDDVFMRFREWRLPINTEGAKEMIDVLIKKGVKSPHRINNVRIRMAKLDEFAADPKYGFDLGVKNKPVTGDKVGYLLKAPLTDPNTGKLLKVGNTDIDHAPAKSISSKNAFVAIESHFNRRKGNIDAAEAEKILAYQIESEPSQQTTPVSN